MDIRNLSASERIMLAQRLWDSVHDSANEIQVTPAQRAVLNQRLAAFELDAHPGDDWKDVRRRISDT